MKSTKNRILKISMLLALICMCISLTACASKEAVASINTRVDSFSADYDSDTFTSHVTVQVNVTNTSDGVDISGFSYTVRFFNMDGVLLYEEKTDHADMPISAGANTIVSKE